MAKGKGKKVASGGPHKKHGPKTRRFHAWTSTIRKQLADAGLLTKYVNYEAWQQACQAKGKRETSYNDFLKFVILSKEEKDAYFKELKK